MTLGLKDLYYAVCTEADGAESYGTPKKMAEAMSADLSVKTADGSLYADDTLSESVTEFASGTLKLGIKDLTPEVLAELLGQAVDKNSVVWAGKEDEPPYVAVPLLIAAIPQIMHAASDTLKEWLYEWNKYHPDQPLYAIKGYTA